MASAQSRVTREVIRNYSYVILWMSVSISVILFNKWLLAFSGFPYPIALTMWHMAFCSTVGFLCVRVARLVKPHNMTPRDYFRRVMPIGAVPTCDSLPVPPLLPAVGQVYATRPPCMHATRSLGSMQHLVSLLQS